VPPVVPPVGGGFSPLDEELGLLPQISLTPALAESAVRLGVWAPFGIDSKMLAHCTHTQVSESTLTRLTARAGAAYAAVQTAQVPSLRAGPAGPAGPPLQQVSVDGAFVPLRGGQWAEVKTLAIGTVQPPVRNRQGEWEVHSTDRSYFSRMTDCATFGELATVETVRRGVLTAGRVAGVVDGAVWAQGFLDLHRPDAVRILDWSHAVGYLAEAARAVFGAETDGMITWLAAQRQERYAGDPQIVLDTLRALRDELGAQRREGKPPPAHAVVSERCTSLDTRTDQIRSAFFRAQGYPSGSGTVESANKLVVEARLKGAGMHWAPAHVNPLLALRGRACSDRWEEAWPQLSAQWRTEAREQAHHRRLARQAARQAAAQDTAPPTPPALPVRPPPPTQQLPHTPLTAPPAPLRPPPTTAARPTPPRPADTHPWRRPFLATAARPRPTAHRPEI
jgi:hypothetical protein